MRLFHLFILLLIHTVLGAANPDCYIIRQDKTGMSAEVDIAPLSAASCAIREILPENIRAEFVVIEEGEYFLSYAFDRPVDSTGYARFNTLKAENSAFVYLVRGFAPNGSVRFHSWLQLPTDSAHPCVTPGRLLLLEDQLNGVLNDNPYFGYVETERQALRWLKTKLDEVYNCCWIESSKSSASTCEACSFNDDPFSNNTFAAFEAIITSAERAGGEFTKLDNLTSVRASRISGASDGIGVNILAKWKELPDSINPESLGDIHLTDDLRLLQLQNPASVVIRTALFDESNCNQLETILSEWALNPTIDPVATAAYGEEIIVLSLGGEIAVYSRIKSEMPHWADYCDYDATYTTGSNDKVILPVAIIIREVLKRTLMGAVNVFIDVGLSVTIEKVFHRVSDDCEVNSWGAAWNRYKRTMSGWQLFLTFVDGAVDQQTFSILAAGLQEATIYLLSSNGNSAVAAAPFEPQEFFKKFVRGCATELLAGGVIDLTKHTAKAIKKLKGENLPQPEFDAYYIDINQLAGFFMRYRMPGIRAWEQALNRGLPDALKRNPDFLKPYARALAERPKIGNHLRGHISPQGNAVGCHFPAAVDGINVRLNPNQPTGFPKYFDSPTNTKLKEGLVQVKDEASGNWVSKQQRSTFFPDTWNEDQVLEEIARLRANSSNRINDRLWSGLASDGTPIEVRYTGADINNLTFSTIFPDY